MAEEPVGEVEQDAEEEEEPIRLPAGWGPVIFLAAVVIASNVGLGMYLRGVMAVPREGAGPAEMAGMHGPPPGAEVAGPGAVGATGAVEGGRAPQTEFEVDPAEFTPELDAYIKQVAVENGLTEGDVGTAREIFEQMRRSGLLPRNTELDLRTILSGHIIERSKHPEDVAGAQAALAGGLPPPGALPPGQKPSEGPRPAGMEPPKGPEAGQQGSKPPPSGAGPEGMEPPPDVMKSE